MLSLYHMYKISEYESNQRGIVQILSRVQGTYRTKLREAKRTAYSKYIECVPNKCKDARKVVAQEHSKCHQQGVALNPEDVNLFLWIL